MELLPLYKKTVKAKITLIEHTLRVPLNMKASAIKEALAKVPDNAMVSMVVDDTENGDYGEIIFTEEHGTT